MSEWQSMETAPRDGTFVLLWAPDYTNRPVLGHWCDRVCAWDSDAGTMEDGPGRKDLDECDGPILWHSLPDDPSEDAIAKEKWLTFSSMLRGYRTDMGMTLEQVSQKTGCTRSYVCQIEHGRSLPSITFVEKFTEAMGMENNEAKIWHRLGAEAHGWKI